jgi:Protein of unknown function (DUF2950)
VLQYAQKFASTPGKRDGLYRETRASELPSPLVLPRRARTDGRVSARQGQRLHAVPRLPLPHPDAPGPGLVAYPAQYGVSGVMTFIVNHEGVVYEKDLGPKPSSIAGAMGSFDPDDTWGNADVAN